jgi:hypothetical protein
MCTSTKFLKVHIPRGGEIHDEVLVGGAGRMSFRQTTQSLMMRLDRERVPIWQVPFLNSKQNKIEVMDFNLENRNPLHRYQKNFASDEMSDLSLWAIWKS